MAGEFVGEMRDRARRGGDRTDEGDRGGRSRRAAPSAHVPVRRSGVSSAIRLALNATAPRVARSGAARVRQAVVQRMDDPSTGSGPELMGGKVLLFVPPKPTTRAAIYCHGVYSSQAKAVTGVTLTYVAPHETTTMANPDAIKVSGSHPADIDGDGNWHNYTLTKEPNANLTENGPSLATASNRAIAWVQGATTTNEIVAALSSAGYTDLLAVHCREVLDGNNRDWDPLTDSEVTVVYEQQTVDRSAMNGWYDVEGDQVDGSTNLVVNARYYNFSTKRYYEVLAVHGTTVDIICRGES